MGKVESWMNLVDSTARDESILCTPPPQSTRFMPLPAVLQASGVQGGGVVQHIKVSALLHLDARHVCVLLLLQLLHAWVWRW